jgi:N-acetylglutamate synthase-like GNAT family acetyltransferase
VMLHASNRRSSFLAKENLLDDIAVRLATITDVPELLPLIRLVAESSGEELPSEADVARIVRHQIEDENHEYVVAEAEGHVVGCVLVSYSLSTWAGAPYAMFQDFIVDKRWRNRGAGSTMLAYARDRARIKGCVRIDLSIHSSLESAKQFFRHWGFQRIDREIMRLQVAPPNRQDNLYGNALVGGDPKLTGKLQS